jgi:hypothetical protein
MEQNEKVIRSYLPHGIVFEDPKGIEVGTHTIILEIPSAHSKFISPDRKFIENICVTTDEVIAQLNDDPTFKAIKDANLIKILGSIPAQYQDQTASIAKAREVVSALQTERDATNKALDEANAKNLAMAKRIAELEAGDGMKEVDPNKIAAAIAAAKETKKD